MPRAIRARFARGHDTSLLAPLEKTSRRFPAHYCWPVKDTVAAFAVALSVLSVVPYVIGMLRGKIRPHAFSWLVWATTTAIAFAGQLAGQGGLIGASVTGASALVSAAISAHAFWRGDRSYVLLDWVSLAGAGLSLVAWVLAGGPLAAVILICVVDAFGAVPTIRKAYVRPREEGISNYLLSSVKWALSFYTLNRLSVVTIAFPAATIAVNAAILTVVLSRRRLSEGEPVTSGALD